MLAPGGDATVKVWAAGSGRLVKIVRGHKSAGDCLSPDSNAQKFEL
jgi:hypothetical protein